MVAGGGTFLLKSSVSGAVAAAIAFAKDVWAVAPNGAPSTDDRIERGPRTVSAPIPAAPPTAPNAYGPQYYASDYNGSDYNGSGYDGAGYYGYGR